MNKSESIAKLTEALSKAQGEIRSAVMDSVNPYFKDSGKGGRYADLASVWDACREPLTKNGFAVIQVPEIHEGKVCVTTILSHSSGEWIDNELTLTPAKPDAQGIGSAITYARRYSLSAMVGIAPEDDDGNSAAGKDSKNDDKEKTKTNNKSRESTTIGAPDAPSSSPEKSVAARQNPESYINEKQRNRLFAIVTKAKWTDDQVKDLLKDHGFTSSKLILVKAYDAICNTVERGDYATYVDLRTNAAPASGTGPSAAGQPDGALAETQPAVAR